MTHFLSDYEQGIKDERERILNLLIEQEIVATDNSQNQFAILVWQGIREQLIQTITGGNNE